LSFALIISNNNLVDYTINRLRKYDFIQEQKITSQTLRLETVNSVQQVTGTLVYNLNNSQTSVSKDSVLNYETSIKNSPTFINNLSNLLQDFCININHIDIYYNNVYYKCNKTININGELFYFLEAQ
jgi:hypothetical protein